MTEVDGDLFGVAGLRSQLMHVVSHRIYHPITIHMDGKWGRSRSCHPFAPPWHENTLLVLGGAHELHVADAERGCQLVEADDRRVSLALFEAAYVLLAEAGKLRQLLLGQTLLLPDPLDVPPDQLAHVHD